MLLAGPGRRRLAAERCAPLGDVPAQQIRARGGETRAAELCCARSMATSWRMIQRDNGSKYSRTSGPSQPQRNVITVNTSVSVAVRRVQEELMM